MIKIISRYDFEDAFNKSETYKNNFSYQGKKALFEYLESYEEDTGEQIELDIVALCCEYTEYSDIEECIAVYSETFDKDISKEQALTELQNYTQVIELENGGIIIQDF